jgi:hypothetical protein
MALSTRARLAALGGGIVLGVLGVTGYAYAGGDSADGSTGTGVSYVTTDDGTGAAADRDCPGHSGGSGGSGGSDGSDGSGPQSPDGSAPAPSPADA